MKFTWYDTGFMKILLAGDQNGLRYLLFENGKQCRNGDAPQDDWTEDSAAFTDVQCQLDEYFAGKRTTFDIRLSPAGTDFQRRVWRALEDIPYGRTVSYADIARQIGSPKAVRAVGAANGRTPISIVIPCHRVISSDGRLAGYGGGLMNKQRLLELEGHSVSDSARDALSQRQVHSEPEPALF